MSRILGLGVVFLVAISAYADEKRLDGTYKLSYYPGGEELNLALIKLETKGGTLVGTVVSRSPSAAISLEKVTQDGNVLRIAFQGGGQTFEGKIGPDAIIGAIRVGNNVHPAKVVKSDLTKIDRAIDQATHIAQTIVPPWNKVHQLDNKALALGLQAQREKDTEKKAELLKEAAEAAKTANAAWHGVYREVLEKYPDSPAVFFAGQMLFFDSQVKITAEEAKRFAEVLTRDAPAYGPMMENKTSWSLASFLLERGDLKELALDYAKKAELSLSAAAPTEYQVNVLTTLAAALKKNDKKDGLQAVEARLAKLAEILELDRARNEVKLVGEAAPAETQAWVLKQLAAALKKNDKTDEFQAIVARLAKLEAILDREYLANMPPFKPEPYAGRKTKGDRVVVMELFTGAQCPACIAADMAFDALVKSYPPSDLVLLQYHLHIPGPDPLTNPDTVARWDYYRSKFEQQMDGTPSVLFNGKAEQAGGGYIGQAEGKYKEYRNIVDPLLEEPAQARLQATASRQGNRIDIKATVANLAGPGAECKLRFVLVEEAIHYVGGSRVRYHHQVVRALPGGAAGITLKEKNSQHRVSINLDELRQNLVRYLDDFAGKQPFPNPERPLDLKHLKVVALVQDDATRAILQAVEVDVTGEPGAGK